MANAAVIAEAMKIQDCMVICAPVPVQRAVAAVLEQRARLSGAMASGASRPARRPRRRARCDSRRDAREAGGRILRHGEVDGMTRLARRRPCN